MMRVVQEGQYKQEKAETKGMNGVGRLVTDLELKVGLRSSDAVDQRGLGFEISGDATRNWASLGQSEQTTKRRCILGHTFQPDRGDQSKFDQV
jgi:hypothetical protein